MQNDITFKNIQSVIKKRMIPLLIVAFLAAIFAYVFSGESFLAPRYKSSAAVFPINIDPYSDESETEQMMQHFDNDRIRKEIIKKFDLGNRYGIKPGDKNFQHQLNKMYNERVSISPTRYESVEIICQDENPEVAKQMAEEVINQYNIGVREVEQKFHREYYKMLEEQLAEQQSWLDEINEKMNVIKERTGIVDFDGQIERITEGYMNLLDKNVQGSRMEEVRKLMTGMRKEGSNLRSLNLLAEYITENMQVTLEAKAEEFSESYREVSYCNVIKKPEATDKKHWPVRWLILLVSIISSLIAAVIFFMLIEK